MPELRTEILKSAGATPDLDAFATKLNRQFKYYCCAGKKAFDGDWSRHILWINTLWCGMKDVVVKALKDRAPGMMVVPVWEGHSLFWELGKIALDWWVLPVDMRVYQDDTGFVLHPRNGRTARILLFDAYASKVKSGTDEEVLDGYDALGT